MYRKCFFKNKGVLSRKFVASGLAAVFSAGMFGSYAGAMEQEPNIESVSESDEFRELFDVLFGNYIKADEDAKEVFKFFINFSEFPKQEAMYDSWKEDLDGCEVLLKNKDFLVRVYAYLLLYKFREFKNKFSISDFLKKWDSDKLANYFDNVLKYVIGLIPGMLLKKINEGWGDSLLKEVKDEQKNSENIGLQNEIIDKNKQNDSENTDPLDKNINKYESDEEITNEHELDKNKTKNKFRNTIFVVPVVIILLVIFFAIKPAGKSKTNTGVPNNNKDDEKVNPSIEPEKDKDDEKVNPSIEPEKDKDDEKMNPSIEPEKDKDDEKVNPSIEPEKDKDDEKVKPPIDPREPSTDPESDDEKVNPPIDPENPLTDPESDDQNPEQNNREEKPSVVPSNILSDNQNTEQNNQEERPSVVLSNILKATGATVTAGTLTGGTYLFNKVLKSGKPSEVKNSRNVDDKYMYLDSDGKEVIKTEEGEEIHNSDVQNNKESQLLEDKDTEEKEEGQEEILVGDELSDDTEATGDEDKNKD